MFASDSLSENDARKLPSDELAEYRPTREQGKEIRWRGRQSWAILFQMDEAEDLWSLPRPRREVSEIAVFGSHEDDLTIASGFLRVAEIAARHWIAHGRDDSLPVPILFNYRHGIELTLKWLIRLAARCLVRDGYTRENLSPLNSKAIMRPVRKPSSLPSSPRPSRCHKCASCS
jgi:hypothetical protein